MWSTFSGKHRHRRNLKRKVRQMPVERQQYVLGFLFTRNLKEVLLVEKQNGPPINKGKWNGVGGKIEKSDESALKAMHRESREETELIVDWVFVGSMSGESFDIALFKATTPKILLTPTFNDVGEKLHWWSVQAVLDSVLASQIAQNVQPLVAHMVYGKGIIEIEVPPDQEELDLAEGATCNRDGCRGVILLTPVENCTCHINPPCGRCTAPRLYCPVCDWHQADDIG